VTNLLNEDRQGKTEAKNSGKNKRQHLK